jgi:KDO2-lipid IV(A) lauroyltransferase
MIRQAKRTPVQKFITDPAVGLFAVTLFLIFKIMPVKMASNVGGALGSFLGRFATKRGQIGMRNLEIAFPEKSVAERREILDKMWEHWGRFFGEMPHLKILYKRSRIEGLDLIKKEKAHPRGGFFCSAHIGNWEVAVSSPLIDDFYLNPVYRPANNPWLDKLMFQRRKGVLIPKGQAGARKMVDVLRNKGYVVILCDQKFREGIDVPFFGKMAKSPSAIATISLKMDLPIFMGHCVRQKDGNFAFHIEKPLDVKKIQANAKDRAEAEYKIMLHVNKRIEGWIRETPEQWLWIHRRFDKSEYK